MENDENQRSVFELTFETDVEDTPLDSDSDISLNLTSESSSENESSDSENNSGDDESRSNLSSDQQRWKVNDRSHIPKQMFTGPTPGPTTQLPGDKLEIDFFLLFFPLTLIEWLVAQTNLNARQKQQVKPDPVWRSVTLDEMKAWLGIRVFMSILQLPQMAWYWSKDCLFGNLGIRRIMKRDRFDKICQYIHANDRSKNPAKDQEGHDKLHLVRPILTNVLEKCLGNYNPHQNVSVDEAMVKFRGRLAFRQYLPAKPTKYGIKVWMRADPVNGYTNEYQVYTGRERGGVEVGLGSRVVKDMTRKIWGHNHIVNMDNYFTSPALFEELLEKGIYARGTVRSNRKGFPLSQLRVKSVKNQGDFNMAQKGELTACVWKDKKHIFTLSTAENPASFTSSVLRKSRNGETKQIEAPVIIPEYNNNMNGVDHADQLRTEYSTYRTSKKWWLYLFWFFFDVAVTNAFIIMKESQQHQKKTKTGKNKVRTMAEFRQALAKQLIGDYIENETAALTTVNAGHFPAKAPKRGRCKQCSKNKIRKEIINMCKQCGVHLCIDCFQSYHRDLLRS